MAAGHHTPTWFERVNAALGLPPNARHSDEWYDNQLKAHGLWQYGAQNVGGASVGNAPAGTGPNVPVGGNAGTPPPPTPPTVPTQADLDAKETDRQAKMRSRRDEWDRLNNQGKYDPDGWQSIGFQPDPVAMPSWWLDGLELGTTAPAVPLPVPPVVAPPVVPQAAVAPASPTALLDPTPGTGTATNALAPALAPTALATSSAAQPWTQPAGQSNWGAWGQQPSFKQQPDAGAWGPVPAAAKTPGLQSWTQPTRQSNSGFGAPNQNQWLQSSTQRPSRQRTSGFWGQQPAGTWGSGKGY